MKGIENIDDHLVIHDATTVGISTTLGVLASAVTGDPATGIATAAVLTAAGIGAMKVGPVRRSVNRAAVVVAEIAPGRKK